MPSNNNRNAMKFVIRFGHWYVKRFCIEGRARGEMTLTMSRQEAVEVTEHFGLLITERTDSRFFLEAA